MHKLLIESYIKQVTKNDIYNFAYNNNIILNEKDIDILYHYLKNNWQDFLYGDSETIIQELEGKISSDKVFALKKLYTFYLNKYQNFL